MVFEEGFKRGDTLQKKKNMKRTARFRNLFVFAKVMGCMKRWRQIAARRVNYTNKFNEVHSKKKRNKSYTVDTIRLTHNGVKTVLKCNHSRVRNKRRCTFINFWKKNVSKLWASLHQFLWPFLFLWTIKLAWTGLIFVKKIGALKHSETANWQGSKFQMQLHKKFGPIVKPPYCHSINLGYLPICKPMM